MSQQELTISEYAKGFARDDWRRAMLEIFAARMPTVTIAKPLSELASLTRLVQDNFRLTPAEMRRFGYGPWGAIAASREGA